MIHCSERSIPILNIQNTLPEGKLVRLTLDLVRDEGNCRSDQIPKAKSYRQPASIKNLHFEWEATNSPTTRPCLVHSPPLSLRHKQFRTQSHIRLCVRAPVEPRGRVVQTLVAHLGHLDQNGLPLLQKPFETRNRHQLHE